MSIAGFTAAASDYRSSKRYAAVGRGPRAIGTRMPVGRASQEQFACSEGGCACSGLDDCIDMFDTDVCGPVAFCDSTGGTLGCACLRP